VKKSSTLESSGWHPSVSVTTSCPHSHTETICFTKEIQSLSYLLIKINFPLIKSEEVDVQLLGIIHVYTKAVKKGKEMYNTHYQCGFLCSQLLISYYYALGARIAQLV
jgi:hypothetical protein